MTSLSGLIKGILLAILTTMMLFLVTLALVSLARLNGGDDTTDTVQALPSGPLTSVPLGPKGEGSVVCFRPTSGDQAFHIELISPSSEVERFVVGIDLIGPGGARSSRVATFPEAEPGVAIQAVIAESADPASFVGCTVTGIQRDRQVTLTGQ